MKRSKIVAILFAIFSATGAAITALLSCGFIAGANKIAINTVIYCPNALINWIVFFAALTVGLGLAAIFLWTFKR